MVNKAPPEIVRTACQVRLTVTNFERVSMLAAWRALQRRVRQKTKKNGGVSVIDVLSRSIGWADDSAVQRERDKGSNTPGQKRARRTHEALSEAIEDQQ